MAVARVVYFEGVTEERAQELGREIEQGEPPEDVPATEMLMLRDPETDRALVILFFDSEDDYRRGHEVLDAMPAEETPGRRSSVTRYEIVARMSR